MADVNNRGLQPILRAMCAADDDRVGMSAVARMLSAAEQLGWALVPMEATDAMESAVADAMLSPARQQRILMAPMTYREAYKIMVSAHHNGPSKTVVDE